MKLELRPIRTKTDYRVALKTAEAFFDVSDEPDPDSAEGAFFEVLLTLIQAYEREHFTVADPAPIDLLDHVMEARGLTRKNLEPFIGPRGRVSNILNRVRPLMLEMIRKLVDGLNLPAEVLIRPYPLRQADAA